MTRLPRPRQDRPKSSPTSRPNIRAQYQGPISKEVERRLCSCDQPRPKLSVAGNDIEFRLGLRQLKARHARPSARPAGWRRVEFVLPSVRECIRPPVRLGQVLRKLTVQVHRKALNLNRTSVLHRHVPEATKIVELGARAHIGRTRRVRSGGGLCPRCRGRCACETDLQPGEVHRFEAERLEDGLMLSHQPNPMPARKDLDLYAVPCEDSLESRDGRVVARVGGEFACP